MTKNWKNLVVQLWLSCAAVLLNASTGIYTGWSSAAIPYLISGELGYSVTSGEAAWIVSALNVGNIVASVWAMYIIDNIGRRNTLIWMALPYILGWVIITYSRTAWLLFLGRFTGGIAYGVAGACGTLYLGEIADIEHRGFILSMVRFMSSIGNLTGYIAGAFFSYYNAIYICASVPTLAFVLAIIFLPESPYQAIMNGDKEHAKQLLEKLKPASDTKIIDEEFNRIATIVEDDMKNKSNYMELLSNPIYRSSLIINLALRVFQHTSGFFVIASYLQTILDRAGYHVSASICSVIYGTMQSIFVPFGTFTVDKIGRKPLLVSSFAGMTLSLFSIGAYFYMDEVLHFDPQVLDQLNWIPLAGIFLFCFCFYTGVGLVLHVIAGETFKTNIKATAVCFCNLVGGIVSVIMTKGYQLTSDAWGVYVPFWIMSVIMAFALVYTIRKIPETKNKTFDEIQLCLTKT